MEDKSIKGATFADLERAVRDLVAASPDFIYGASGETCYYSPDSPHGACLFGQAFLALGADADKLSDNETLPAQTVFGNLSGTWLNARQAGWTVEVQVAQDSHIPWRDALAEGDSRWPLEDPDA